MHIRDYVKTPCKKSLLNCYQPSHYNLVIQKLCDMEPKEVASFDPVEWANSEPDASSEPDSPSKQEEDLEGVSISVRSSSIWEVMTTHDSTFWGCPKWILEMV